MQKSEKFAEKFNKKMGLSSWHQNAGRVFYSQIIDVTTKAPNGELIKRLGMLGLVFTGRECHGMMAT